MKLYRKTTSVLKKTYESFRKKALYATALNFLSLIFLRLTLLIGLACMLYQPVSAQDVHSGGLDGIVVSGKVVGVQKEPLAGVSISLYKNDSTLVEGAATDGSGIYRFSRLEPGTYYTRMTMVGFQPLTSPRFELRAGDKKQNPVVTLIENATKLSGLTVTAKKPFIERQVDKTVLNIESDVIASGGTALEALQRAPDVTVDKDDNIQLRGKSGVMIMIDDKLTYMSMAQVTTMLKNMPASAVNQIEIITQPSAKYDAAGNSGIINIKTKKLKKMGLNGVVTAGFGKGKYARSNGSLNLNYQTGNFNFFTNYDYSHDKRFNTLVLERVVRSSRDTTVFNGQARNIRDYTNHNYKAGVDYTISKNHTLGVQVSGYANHGSTLTTSNQLITSISNHTGMPDSILNAKSKNLGRFSSIDYNLNYRGKLDTSGTEVSGDLDYSRFTNGQITRLTNTLLEKDKVTVIKGPFIIDNNLPSHIDIKVGKFDFSHPLSKTLKLETGMKLSSVTTNNNVKYDSIINGKMIPSLRESNEFIYKENIMALYASINAQLAKNTSLQLGLRVEHTHSDGNSVTLHKDVKRNYTDFFPNISFSQKLNKSNVLGFSYTRRIDRPSYDDLNPFRFYLDQYTYGEGNPYLNPQYTDAFEITNTFKQSTLFSVNYSHTRQAMLQTLLQDSLTKVTKQTTSNISGINSYGFTFSTPVVLTKWWTLTPNLNLSYNRYLAASANLGGALNSAKLAYNLNLTSAMTLPKDFIIELNAFYNSSAVYGYLHADPQYAINGGIQKSFLKKKANLKFNVTDIFKTNKFSGNQPNINLSLVSRYDSRRATLTFTYRFGSNPNGNHKESATGSENEKSRVKSGH